MVHQKKSEFHQSKRKNQSFNRKKTVVAAGKLVSSEYLERYQKNCSYRKNYSFVRIFGNKKLLDTENFEFHHK